MKYLARFLLKAGLCAGLFAPVQPVPAAVVAFYDVAGFVDTSPAFNLRAELERQGHTTRRITANDRASVTAALTNGTDILVFPTLVGNPLLQMDAATETAIRYWLGNGGDMLVAATISSLDEQLVNGLLGWSVAPAPSTSGGDTTPAAAGTAFEGGPANLGIQNSYGWTTGSLPTKSNTYYLNASGTPSAQVVIGSYGHGWVGFLASTWGGGGNAIWNEVLRRMVKELRGPCDVALFFNDAYVDNGQDTGEEANNVKMMLEEQGRKVSTFEGALPEAWTEALADARVLVIPELETFNLAADLIPAARNVIQTFVSNGGSLMLFGHSGSNDETFLNTVFGFGLAASVGGGSLRSGAAASTEFSRGPSSLPANSLTTGWLKSSLPGGGTLSAYEGGSGTGAYATIARIPHGHGKIVLIGWDAFNAAPRGTADGGWNDAIRAAMDGLCPRKVSMFYNEDYLTLDNGFLGSFAPSTAKNSKGALEFYGYAVETFGDISAQSFQRHLDGFNGTLVIPKLDSNDLHNDLSSGAVSQLRSFVRTQGGTLLVLGVGTLNQQLLIDLFGYGPTTTTVTGSGLPHRPDQLLTRFIRGPTSLTPLNPNSVFARFSLPSGARSPYRSSNQQGAFVVMVPEGRGRVILTSEIYFNAFADRAADKGWLEILNRAVLEAPCWMKPRTNFALTRFSEPAVFNPFTSTWFYQVFEQTGWATQQFGFPGVVTVPGDYNGDGLSNIAVFHPPTGNWYVLTPGGVQVERFGFNGVRPVQADYDGDGLLDKAVFHPPTGTWYILASSAGFSTTQFGFARVIPVPGDYDGDGKCDKAAFDPVTSTWFFLTSRGGFWTKQFGFPGVTPVPGDYDGDGKWDIAVHAAGNHTWYILGSRDGFSATQYGFGNTVPVPTEYDDDARTDLAVYHPGTRTWYIRKSRWNLFYTTQFGQPGANPVY